MKYKFNDSNISVGYIKELLHDFHLPRCKVYSENKPIYEGNIYIKDQGLYECVSGSLLRIADYRYNMKFQNITTNFNITSSIYDTATHIYLGNYLRFIRDYKGLNLMPLYNCYSNEMATGIDVNIEKLSPSGSDVIYSINTDDDRYYYYLVPVKFDSIYTIGIDAAVSYNICLMIYTGDSVSKESKKLILNTYRLINGSTIRTPYTINTTLEKDSNLQYYLQHEDNLRLFIKLPKVAKSSITVLEGDYTLNTSTLGNILTPTYIYNDERKSDYALTDISTVCKLSLLDVNSKISYPFADRLIEYLVGNAITNLDDITSNIRRVLDAIYLDGKFTGIYGIFDGYLKSRLYDSAKNKVLNKFSILCKCDSDEHKQVDWLDYLRLIDLKDDLLYFVDKDLEEMISK